ncbi:MAG TPA: DUF3140 domain-containing protein [Rubricoccaceae bacterium]|jgi:hypothetical protein
MAIDWTDEQQQTYDDFREAVNMAPAEIERWLATDDSQAVGQKDDGGESVGHASGRRIVEIRRKKKDQITADDVAHMATVAGYVHRHLAQHPGGDITETPWRYSLMNWGHDPLKNE